jgi:hypothetical protein
MYEARKAADVHRWESQAVQIFARLGIPADKTEEESRGYWRGLRGQFARVY